MIMATGKLGCMDWLKGSTLDSTERKAVFRGQAILLRMKKGDDKVTMAMSESLSMKKGEYIVFPNIPGTNVEACMSSFTVSGNNLPDAARRFVETTGIGNPKGFRF